MTEKRGMLNDELRGYFGLLKHDATTLSERALIEKIQRDVKDIIFEVYE